MKLASSSVTQLHIYDSSLLSIIDRDNIVIDRGAPIRLRILLDDFGIEIVVNIHFRNDGRSNILD